MQAPANESVRFGGITFWAHPAQPRIAIFQYADGFTADDFREAMKAAVVHCRANAPAGIISEVRGTAPAGAQQRKELGAIANELDAEVRGLLCGSAVVTDSGLMRGVLTAVGWVYRPGYAIKPFTAREDAVAWLETCIAAELNRAT